MCCLYQLAPLSSESVTDGVELLLQPAFRKTGFGKYVSRGIEVAKENVFILIEDEFKNEHGVRICLESDKPR